MVRSRQLSNAAFQITELAVEMLANATADRRVRRLLLDRAEALARDPVQQGKPPVSWSSWWESACAERAIGATYTHSSYAGSRLDSGSSRPVGRDRDNVQQTLRPVARAQTLAK